MPPMYNINESYYNCGVGNFVDNLTPPTRTIVPFVVVNPVKFFNPPEHPNTFIKMCFVLFCFYYAFASG